MNVSLRLQYQNHATRFSYVQRKLFLLSLKLSQATLLHSSKLSIFYIKYNSRVWAKFILPKTIHKIKLPSNSFYSQHFKNILKDAPIVPLFLTKNQSFTENVNEFLQEQSKDLLNCQYYNISNFFWQHKS